MQADVTFLSFGSIYPMDPRLPPVEIPRHLRGVVSQPSYSLLKRRLCLQIQGKRIIHAVIISGLSDPAKVIASPNVTLTGGLVALGKTNTTGGTVSTWSPGLRIFPDYGLLTGAKIPPVTPNIIDVRIVRQQVQADFASPGQHPGD
jgi:hypothetical protein